jgi:hypothetical protein
MNKKLFLAIAALAPLACFASLEKKVEKSFPVTPGGQLKVNVCKGGIEVLPSKDNEVKLILVEKLDVDNDEEAQKALEDYNFSFTQEGNEVLIVAKTKSATGIFSGLRNNKVQLGWKLTIPEKFNINLNTAGGSIHVGDLQGNVKVDTSGGSIHIGNIVGPVDADTSGGSIRLDSSTDKTRLDTSGGSIAAGTLKAASVLDTSGGSISVKSAEAALKADTSGGSIDVNAPAPLKGDIKLDTSGGSIHFRTGDAAAFDLEAESSGGRVANEFALSSTKVNKRDHVEGQVNGGGPKVSLDTSGGSVHVDKLK